MPVSLVSKKDFLKSVLNFVTRNGKSLFLFSLVTTFSCPKFFGIQHSEKFQYLKIWIMVRRSQNVLNSFSVCNFWHSTSTTLSTTFWIYISLIIFEQRPPTLFVNLLNFVSSRSCRRPLVPSFLPYARTKVAVRSKVAVAGDLLIIRSLVTRQLLYLAVHGKVMATQHSP